MNQPAESIAVRVLRTLARVVMRYPRLFFYPQVILFGLCVFYTVEKLQFSTDRDDLVGADKKYHQNFLQFRKEFPGQNDVVTVVESEDSEKNRQFVERLGMRLEAETNIFMDVFYKGDLNMMGKKALLFVPPDDLNELRKTLADYRPFIQNFARATNLVSMVQLVNAQFRSANREASEENESMVKALPALRRIFEQAEANLHRQGAPPSPGLDALFGAGAEAEQQKYITFGKGRLYLVTAKAVSADKNGLAIERLRELVKETQAEVPGVNVGITGETVLEFDEMAQSQTDSLVATVISFVFVGIIFIYGYRETGRPIKATISLVIGLGYTMGYTTLFVGHLNILTITFAPILIGLAIDFGVHLITRYEEELRGGRSQAEALEKAMVYTGQGIFTGAFTTAGAFYAMALTDFKGIQEMGIITGGGLLICLVPMMTVLPVLLLRGRQNVIDHDHPPVQDKRARVERIWLDRPGTVIALSTVLCVLSFTQFRKIHFDYNLLNMQSAGLPAVVFQEKLIESADKSVLFAAVVTDTLDEAIAMEQRLTNLTSVLSVDSMARYLTGDQSEQLALIKQIKADTEPIQFAPYDRAPVDINELNQRLWALQGYLALAIEVVQQENEPELLKELQALRETIGRLRQQMQREDVAKNAEKLAAYQRALFADIHDTINTLKTQDASGPLREADLPIALRNRFVGQTGKHLLQVYPREDVWQREKQKTFVEELRTIDPNVTGTPVQLFEYTSLLKDSYVEAAWYALGAIVVLVFFHFRNIACVLLSLLPVAIGSIWMVGLMGVTDTLFNPANIMTLPLVIGIGVTNGIHILNRFAEEPSPSILAKSTGKAVLISALTTMAGFGSLLIAKHQGIASLGYVMTVGVAACMIAGLTILPAVLILLMRKGWRINKKTQ